MPSEEMEQKEKLEKEEISVPLYFDRYVASELRALGQQIINLKESLDERFAQVDNCFAQVDNRFSEVDRRFNEVDRRFVEFREDVDKRFDKLEKWAISLFFPLIVGIMAIIVKMFIFGK